MVITCLNRVFCFFSGVKGRSRPRWVDGLGQIQLIWKGSGRLGALAIQEAPC